MAAQLPLHVCLCVCERVFKYIFMNTKIPTAAARAGGVVGNAMTAIRAFNTWHRPQAQMLVLIFIASICMPGHATADLARQFALLVQIVHN